MSIIEPAAKYNILKRSVRAASKGSGFEVELTQRVLKGALGDSLVFGSPLSVSSHEKNIKANVIWGSSVAEQSKVLYTGSRGQRFYSRHHPFFEE